MNDDWRREALCAQVDLDLFFPEKGISTQEPKRVCQMCPTHARMACLLEGFELDDRFGIRGGISERDRRKLKPALVAAGDDQVEVERVLIAGMERSDAAWRVRYGRENEDVAEAA